MSDDSTPSTPALEYLAATGLEYEVKRTPRADSVEEAARLRGLGVTAVIKSIVVRRGEGDFVFVLVPGDRAIDWSKLRAQLGVRRLSLPDAEEAREATGYERGAITPFGSNRSWPVVADERMLGETIVSIGGGAHGVSVTIDPKRLIDHLGAQVADVTKA